MKNRRLDTTQLIINIIMFLILVICVYPFIYLTVLSLNDPLDAQRGGLYLWPRVFSLESYKAIFKTLELVVAYKITLFIVVIGTTLHVLLTAMFAYALTKKNFVFRKFLNWWILIPMYFTGGLIPTYVIFNSLELVNNIFVYIIPHLLATFYILLVRTLMAELPPSLEESAFIDGAGEFLVFRKIIFPLSAPVLATVALFVAVFHWNDWYSEYTYMANEKLWTAQNVLLQIIQSNEASNLAYLSKMNQGFRVTVTADSIKMAMIVVTTIPIVIVYPFLQKYFVKGMMVGSIKG